MENTRHSGVVTGRYRMKNLKTGAVYEGTQGDVNASINLSWDKQSVDTGCFIPGIYRANPYLIFRETYGSSVENIHSHAAVGDWEYDSWLDGDFAMFLASRARTSAGLSSILSNVGNYQTRALIKARAKVGQQAVGLGENLGELRETLQLLRSPFKGLRDFLFNHDYRRLGLLNKLLHHRKSGSWSDRGGTLLNGAAAGKAAAGAWLELRYGLMPLVYTVQDLMKLANEKVKPFDPNRIRTKGALIEKEFKKTLPSYPQSLGMTSLVVSQTLTDEMKFTSSVQYQTSKAPTYGDALGLTPKFLPELMWELTRLSFVVDWWFDVGSWLALYRFQPEITILGNTNGVKVDRSVAVTTMSAFSGTQKYTLSKDIVNFKNQYYQRIVNQDLPNQPIFKLDYNNHLHTVDALALILQQVLNKIKR